MKTKLSLLGLIASLSAVVTVSAQNTAVTKPVGYHTETILGDAFTLLGINVGNAVAAAGDFDAASATDNDVDFTTLLTAGTSYTVQNLATGASAPVTGFDATSLTTTLSVDSGDTYEIRQDATVDSVFGINNESGIGEGSALDADVIWIPQADGSFLNIYRDPGFPAIGLPAGWKQIGGAGDGSTVIPFDVAIFIQRRVATPLDIVFVGHVRTSATTFNVLPNQFNFINRVLPVGISLDDSQIEESANFLSGDALTGDVIWMPDGSGGYINYHYDPGFPAIGLPAGWKQIGGGNAGAAELTAGYAIQARGAGGAVTVSIPGGLDL